jgi:IMP dehydrogenase
MDIPLSLTFDEISIVPRYSEVESRSNVSLKTRISKRITLNIPLISSCMDTVTESEMAIGMARNGGIGIIHRYCTANEQVEMVRKVKRAESYIITDPYFVYPGYTIKAVKETIARCKVSTYIVIDTSNNVCGILTNRDIKAMETDPIAYVSDYMTNSSKLIVIREDEVTMEEAKWRMCKHRIQKLPVVDEKGKLKGLVCMKDIERINQRPLANLDSKGRLRCGAAIGVKEDTMERVKKLISVDVDLLVIDVAHGHSKQCIDTLKSIKAAFPDVDVIAGNIATCEGAKDLIEAGADGIKCGVGNGSICITRIVSGCGVPQLTALMDAAKICKQYNVPLISDGGNRNSGNICKALAAGASCVMLGRMIAGSDESAGKVQMKDNKRVKVFRGMASYEANLSNAVKQGIQEPNSLTSHIEGVQGYVPCTGPLSDTITQICNGLKSGISYVGANNIEELQSKATFVRMTNSGQFESGVHDVTM